MITRATGLVTYGAGRSTQAGGKPAVGRLRDADAAAGVSSGLGLAGQTVPTGGRAPLTRYASMNSVVHSLRP